MAIHLQFNPDEVKYDSFNDMIDFHDSNAPYLDKVQGLKTFNKSDERESKPKHLSVKTFKPVFFVTFENNIVKVNKKFNLRFPGRDTLTIDPLTNTLRTFKTREIGPSFLNELGGPCENDENFVWNKSECKDK
ncbi:hypothetical protein COB55_05110 [Candidatus Wolfebacteria bacterium]|nr:MAG: hypothetical protein COB55_05110 [Candidatus Wolfebacteria bacterium]